MWSKSPSFNLILVVAAASSSSAFVQTRNAVASRPSAVCVNSNGGEKQWTVDDTVKETEASPFSTDKFSFPNPLSELGDMFSSLDDVIDDFFNKRSKYTDLCYLL